MNKKYDWLKNRHRWLNNNPWMRSYLNAKKRCSRCGVYYKRINFRMNPNDFKFLWFRDKAYLMKKPSIDRVNPDNDYVRSNCRFIEQELNNRFKPVEQYSLSWKLLRRFKSVTEAQLSLGVKSSGSFAKAVKKG